MKLASTILTIVFSFMLLSCSGRITECTEFKTGTYEFLNEEINTNYRIVRDNDKQIETNIKTNETSSFTINWISDCKYELSLLETNDPNYEMLEGRVIEVNIYNPGKDRYDFSSKIKGTVEEYTASLKRIY